MLLLSPTKKMKPINTVTKTSKLYFENESEHLRKQLGYLTKKKLSEKMKIKNQVLEDTYNYYKSSEYFLSYQIYDGIAFKEINKISLKNERLNDLYILSALYGMTNALDQIKPYRLDFTMSKLFDINLYDHWIKKINKQITKINPNFILDLSSKEFSKLIDKGYKNYYHIEFDKNYNSSFLKKARGHLAYLYLNEEVTKIEDYQKISNAIIKNITINQNILIVSLNMEGNEKSIS